MTTFSTNTTPVYSDNRTPSRGPSAWGRLLASVEARIVLFVFALLALWAVAIATFGLVALISVALSLVPLMFILLMMITVGK